MAKVSSQSNQSILNAIEQNSNQYFGPKLDLCMIQDAMAHAGSYTVQTSTGDLTQVIDALGTSGTPLGGRPVGGYPVGAHVLVYFDQSLGDHGVIICPYIRSMEDPNLVVPDSITPRGSVGVAQDPIYYSAFQDPEVSLLNASAGRHIDTIPTDCGLTNDMGLSLILGRFMASLKASDAAKIEAFFGDNLLRIVGYNYELFTAGKHEYCVNNQGEYDEVVRMTPYPWEAMGSREPGNPITRTEDGKLLPNAEYCRR